MNELYIQTILSRIYSAATYILNDSMRSMILYGSYARGDFDAESDLDILILADIRNDECWQYRKSISTIIDDLSLQYDIVISLHIIDCETFDRWESVVPFYQNVKQDGVLIRA